MMVDYWTDRLTEAFDEHKKVEEKLTTSKAEAASFEQDEIKLTAKVERLNQELKQKAVEVAEARKVLESCRVLNGDSGNCAAQEAELLEAKKAYINFRNDKVSPSEEELEELRSEIQKIKRKITLAQPSQGE